jgi:ferredoxin/coenzyme F420-reducing hydrogenase delta subunit
MVWDTFGLHLAREGARMLDALPVLSEPTSRAFTGEDALPSAFFFLALFAHIGVPLGMAVVFWLHVKRLARPLLLPPRPLLWTVVGALTLLAVVRPLDMAPRADPFTLPDTIPVDIFFAFWMPFTAGLGGGAVLLLGAAAGLALLAVPMVTRRRGRAVPPPSTVDEDVCVGCVQCSLDCPYGAITMVDRTGPRSDLVARVDPALCVSCGICAGSCPPMGVGPAGRTGRDQLAHVREFLARPLTRPGAIVVVTCSQGAGAFAGAIAARGGVPYPVNCAGNLHTSVIELLLRGGAAGILVLACPPRDCWNREGPRWLRERVYNQREAELQVRVDRRRVRIAEVNAGEQREALAALAQFATDVAALDTPRAAETLDVEMDCEPAARGRRR